MMTMRRVLVIGVVLFAISLAATVRAQTGAALLLKPWPQDQAFEGVAGGYFENSAHSDSGDNVQFSDYESSGRIRIMPGNLISPRVGYDFRYINADTKSTVIPHELSDQSIALGTAIAQYSGWVAGATFGLGYAGDSAFSRGSAWYGKATVAFGKKFDDRNGLGIVIDYDGNRPYYPDFPLPGFAYIHRHDPHLLLTLGVPYSSIEWTPTERIKVEGSYTLLQDLAARISYEFIKHWTVFTAFHTERDAFHVDDFPKDRRLLFENHRVEGGVQFVPCDHATLSLSGGYAFGNRFSQGFDFDKTHTVLKISDAPFLHAGLEVRF